MSILVKFFQNEQPHVIYYFLLQTLAIGLATELYYFFVSACFKIPTCIDPKISINKKNTIL